LLDLEKAFQFEPPGKFHRWPGSSTRAIGQVSPPARLLPAPIFFTRSSLLVKLSGCRASLLARLSDCGSSLLV